MNLIVLIGSGAVGKMTVGQELMKITDYRLFHNHMMIEPVIEIFGRFDGAVIKKLREDIFDAFLKTAYGGMIFTYMWAFDMQSDWDYIKSVADKFEATGGTVYYVELVADREVRIERNKTENRLRNKASKRDIVVSEDRMLREETKYRLVSNEGEIPFKNYMRIDNTNLEPEEVALMIKEHFGLPGPSVTELMNRVKLEIVRDDEIEQLHQMQVESFMPLYEKYGDAGSPAIESIEKVRARDQHKKVLFYSEGWSQSRRCQSWQEPQSGRRYCLLHQSPVCSSQIPESGLGVCCNSESVCNVSRGKGMATGHHPAGGRQLPSL